MIYYLSVDFGRRDTMDEIYWAVICAFFYLALKLSESKPNKVQYYYKWYCYYVYALIMSTLLCFICMWRGRDIRNMKLCQKFLSPMTRFHGVTWHFENAELLTKCGRAVIVSNHQSSMDTLGLLHAVAEVKNWFPVSKKEMLYFGPVGLLTYLIGTIIIDRKNTKEAYQKLNEAEKHMIEKDMKIWLFPEGTRNIQKKVKLLPFKRGAFKVAVATQSPIVPVVYSPYYFAYENKHIFENGGHVIMRCLDPIPTTGLTMDDVPELTERLHKIILNAYDQLSKEVMYRFPEAAKRLQ